MGMEFLALLLVLVGVLLSFKLKGRVARRLRRWYVIGLILSLGGCLGSLGWLGAETSGNSNFFNSVNPLIWVGLFTTGALVMVVNSLIVLWTRAEQDLDQSGAIPQPSPDGQDDGADGTREF